MDCTPNLRIRAYQVIPTRHLTALSFGQGLFESVFVYQPRGYLLKLSVYKLSSRISSARIRSSSHRGWT
jgi:hypothetical protein